MMTFEEWRAAIQVQISEETQSELQRLHGVDAAIEVESVLIHKYNCYVQEQETPMRVVNDIREFIEPTPATFRESTQLLSIPFMLYKEPSSFVVEWYGIENEVFVFDQESVTDKVKSILYNFPAIAEEDLELSTQSDELETLIQNKYGDRIAVQSKRGSANVKYENVILYWGSSVIDRPFTVALNSESGKYAVICHPDIEKYGFVMQHKYTLLDQLNVVLEKNGHSMLSSEAIGHMNALDFLEYLEHCQLGIFKNENP